MTGVDRSRSKRKYSLELETMNKIGIYMQERSKQGAEIYQTKPKKWIKTTQHAWAPLKGKSAKETNNT